MKGKQLVVILILLVAVGGGALLLIRHNDFSWTKTATAQSKVINFPLNDVSDVIIRGNGAELNLAKKDNVWRVKERADYPADFDKVSALVRKLWELRAVQEVKIGPSQLGRMQLAELGQGPVSGTVIELKDANDKPLASLRLGKNFLGPRGEAGGPPVGRYVMLQDGSNRVFIVSETLSDANPRPELWLYPDFVRMENLKVIAVTGTAPSTNWTIIRQVPDAPWKLSDAKAGEELDGAKAARLAALLSKANFTDVVPPNTPVAETGLDKFSTARVETFDNFVYELRIGKLMEANYPVLISVKAELPKERTPAVGEKPEEKARLEQDFQLRQTQLAAKLAREQGFENWSYLMAKTTIDPLLQDRNSLLVQAKPSASPAASAPGNVPKRTLPQKSLAPRS